MLKIQETLFFRSNVRKLMLAVLLLGLFFSNIWILVSDNGLELIRIYGNLEGFACQADLLIYYLVIILFLAFDYFHELPDAEWMDAAKVCCGFGRSEATQFFVMLQWVMLSAVMFFSFSVVGFHIADTLTAELVIYLIRFFFLYVVLNGIVALLLAWLLSRVVGKLVGYICIILFVCAVSPIATSELGFLSMILRGLHEAFKVILILPEGVHGSYFGTLLPVNFSIISRTLFWVILCISGLLLNSRIRYRVLLSFGFLALLIGDYVYMHLPTSFYSDNDSYGVEDSVVYDQMAYIIDGAIETQESDEFKVDKYEMTLEMDRVLKASVSVYPVDQTLPSYEMTLYHLYQVQSVTDGKGNPLNYVREGDYLKVDNVSEKMEVMCIHYEGGLANFYANADDCNLPGSFAYYPLPGYRTIFEDYDYVDNRFEDPVLFDVTVCANRTVYSDLERIEENHFVGESYGPTFVSGFMKEVVLENDVRIVYPYLEKMYAPNCEVSKEDYKQVMEYIDKEWKHAEKKDIVILPVGQPIIISDREGSFIGSFTWHQLSRLLDEYGQLKIDNTFTHEDAVEKFLNFYSVMMETEPETFGYDDLKESWDQCLDEAGEEQSSENEFEEFFRTQFGQEQYERLMKAKEEER